MNQQSNLIENQRHLFDIQENVHYLNCAYMSPLLNTSVEKGKLGIQAKSHPWDISAPDFFIQSGQARALFAGFINATQADIAIIPAVSYGTAVATLNIELKEGDEVLVLAEEFPSNLYAWREKAKSTGATIKTVKRPRDNDWTSAVLEALDAQVRVAVLPHTHWADGGQLNLELISSVLRKFACALVIDVTQSLGVVSVDVQKIKPDFLICATYKWLLGPYSLGFLYAAPKYHQGTPIEQGWVNRPGADNFSQLTEYTDVLNPDASRFDVGERSNMHLLPVVIDSMKQIDKWGQENIAATLEQYTDVLLEMLEGIGFESCYKAYRSPHYLGVTHPRDLPADLLKKLARQKIFISQRGRYIRISPHLYNNLNDAQRLTNALGEQF